MSQLLPGSLISLVSAVLLARWMNQAGLPWLALSLAVCPLVFLGRRAVCFLLIFEAGLFLTIQRLSLPANHVAGCLPRQVPVLWGTVLEQTREEIFSSEILLKAEKWSAGEDREFSCCGLVLVKSSPFLSLEPGQKVRLENVRLRYPGSDGNPGRSDRSLYWESRGIFLLGQAREVSVVDARQPVHLYLLVLLRRRIETIFSGRLRGFPEETALLQTITLGRKQVVSFLRVLGLRSGTYHLLVISGLHVGFLFLLWSVLSFPWRRRFLRYHRVFSLAGLLVIWGYAWLTGLHLPIVRAALMISFFLLGEVVGRDISGLESITLAALVLLLANPLSLFDAGFQLSFVATAGILLTGSALEEYSFTRNLAWRRFWCASLGAYIFVLPLVLYHFGQVCLTGILNNLVVVPVAAVTTMVGFLFWWWPVIFAWPARCLAWLLLALLTVLARFSPAVSF
ncbi:MAG TPA: ComEC/Rec2 family competence protein, partial [bacterium]|nr:ComEC/Rec2 family competence protein [bacterium]